MAQRKEANRAHLLDVAIKLFGKQGYHATTVPMIVKDSGGSTGSFYFYFRNKEDVFAAVLEAFGKKIADTLSAAIDAAGEKPHQRMRAAVERLILFMAENPDEARILIVEFLRSWRALAKNPQDDRRQPFARCGIGVVANSPATS